MNPFEERNTQKALAIKASGCRNEVEYFLLKLRELHLTHSVTWEFSIWSTYHVEVELPNNNKLDVVMDMSGNLMYPAYVEKGDERVEFKDLDSIEEYLHDLKIKVTHHSFEEATEYLKNKKSKITVKDVLKTKG